MLTSIFPTESLTSALSSLTSKLDFLASSSFSTSSSTSPSTSSPVVLTRCAICLEEFDSNDRALATRPFKCRIHSFCIPCATSLFEVHIREGSLEGIICPIPACKRRQVRTNVIQDLVAPELFERFLTVSFNRALDSMTDIVYCPQCRTAVLNSAGSQYAHCGECDYCFCLGCNEKWHPGKCTDKRDDGYKAYLAQSTKRCPSCHVHIEKNGGCDHMYCSRCRTHFQWSQAPLSIYAPKPSEEDIAREHQEKQEQARVNKELERQQRKIEFEREQKAKEAARTERMNKLGEKLANSRACPSCRAIQKKVGKLNHIVCKNCRSGFCFECGQTIQGTKHFSSTSKCRQHS